VKYKIIAPNKEFIGVVATVGFVKGVGETDSEYLAGWFSKKGYLVATDEVETLEIKEYTEAELNKLNTAQLDALGVEFEIDLSECKNKAEKVSRIFAELNKGE